MTCHWWGFTPLWRSPSVNKTELGRIGDPSQQRIGWFCEIDFYHPQEYGEYGLGQLPKKKMPDFMLIFSTFFGCTDALRKKTHSRLWSCHLSSPPLRNWPQLNPPFFPPNAKVFKSLSSSNSRLPAMAPIQPLVEHGKCVSSQMFCWDAYPLPWQINGKAKIIYIYIHDMNREITFWKHESLLVGYFHWVKMHRNSIVCICTVQSLQDHLQNVWIQMPLAWPVGVRLGFLSQKVLPVFHRWSSLVPLSPQHSAHHRTQWHLPLSGNGPKRWFGLVVLGILGVYPRNNNASKALRVSLMIQTTGSQTINSRKELFGTKTGHLKVSFGTKV